MRIESGDFRVRPGAKVKLDKWPTSVKPYCGSREAYQELLGEHVEKLGARQRPHYAWDRYALLLIFQGMDTAGKEVAVGGYIALAGLWAAPVSKVSMNPIRSFDPDLVRGDLNSTWIYIVGPLLGSLVGIGFEWIPKGKGTAAGSVAAQGTAVDRETNL